MDNDIEALIKQTIQCAYTVHEVLSQGYLENIYKKALLIELQAHGIDAQEEVPLQVYYKGHIIGDYYADIVVAGKIILELKAVRSISPLHGVQLVNYLQATGLDTGLIINFGEHPIGIQRKYRSPKRKLSTD